MGANNKTLKDPAHAVNVEMESDNALQKIADDNQAVLLALIGPYVPYIHDSSGKLAAIEIADEFAIEEAIRKIREMTDIKKLYLLVNTRGGSIQSSFKLARAIRESFDDITVFVPHMAASGGTMIALAGDRIRMGIMSQLGPLDPQITYDVMKPPVSVNAILRAQERLYKKSSEKSGQEPSPEYPMLDPIVIETVIGMREETIMYMDNILGNNAMKKQIIRSLAFRFPTHGFVIDRDVAKKIGVNIEDDSVEPHIWEQMRKWNMRYIHTENSAHFVRLCIPKNKM